MTARATTYTPASVERLIAAARHELGALSEGILDWGDPNDINDPNSEYAIASASAKRLGDALKPFEGEADTPPARRFKDETLVEIDLGTWEHTGDDGEGSDPKSRLLGTLTINGVHHHIEAIQVVVDDEDCQQAASPVWRSLFDELYAANSCDGAVQTVSYDGRDYALFLSPYC